MSTPTKEARIFYVETQLHMLARAPGGSSRDQAMKAATKEVKKLEPAFGEWFEREFESLGAAIGRAQDGAPTSEWLDNATIHCRQLHDVGATMGYELVSVVADLLYKTLEGVAGGAECRVDTITCYMDALQLVRQDQFRNMSADQAPALISGLRKMAEQVNGVAM